MSVDEEKIFTKKLKILHAGNQAFGFATFMFEHLNYFRNNGYDVELSVDTSVDKIFIKKLESNGYKINHINYKPRKYSVFNFVQTLIDHINLFRKNNYDLIVVHFPVISFFVRIAAKLCNVKNVVYFQHALSFNNSSRPSLKLIMPVIEFIINRLFTDYLICINPEDLETLTKCRLIQKKKIFYLNSLGVNTNEFKKISVEEKNEILKEYNIPNNSTVIGTVCRMIKPKGIYDILESAKNINKDYNNVYFIFVGDGIELNNLKKYSQENNLSEKVIFTGYTTEVKKYLSVMDIFVLPTYYQEGMPISVLEAMAMEKAVIVTNTKGCRNIISNDHDGLFVEPQNVKDLQEKIMYLINNPQYSEKLSENARLSVLEKFSSEKIIKDNFNIVKTILSNQDQKENNIINILNNIIRTQNAVIKNSADLDKNSSFIDLKETSKR